MPFVKIRLHAYGCDSLALKRWCISYPSYWCVSSWLVMVGHVMSIRSYHISLLSLPIWLSLQPCDSRLCCSNTIFAVRLLNIIFSSSTCSCRSLYLQIFSSSQMTVTVRPAFFYTKAFVYNCVAICQIMFKLSHCTV